MISPGDALTGALAIFFAAWLLASIPNQFRWHWWSAVARHDALVLLPRWTFFAPRPGQHDLHVLFRDVAGGVAGPWRELDRPAGMRWARAVWNPERFARKTITDACGSLLVTASRSRGNPREVQLATPYLDILTWVTAAGPAARPGATRQFAVVRTQTDRPGRSVEVAFVSFEHPLP